MVPCKSHNVRFNLALGVLLLLLIAATCKNSPFVEHFYAITVYNNSPDTICPYLALGNGLTQYPDTALPVPRPALVKIAPQKSFNYYSRKPFEEVINNLVADTLSVFILDNNIYRDSSWTVIRNNYLILRRNDFSANDLKSMNWKIAYP